MVNNNNKNMVTRKTKQKSNGAGEFTCAYLRNMAQTLMACHDIQCKM